MDVLHWLYVFSFCLRGEERRLVQDTSSVPMISFPYPLMLEKVLMLMGTMSPDASIQFINSSPQNRKHDSAGKPVLMTPMSKSVGYEKGSSIPTL
jgi:hypothetical protein